MKYAKFLSSLFFILIFFYACQIADKEENTTQEEIIKTSKDSDNQAHVYFSDMVFVYGLGCNRSWTTQGQTRGKLNLNKDGKFKFVLYKVIEKTPPADAPANFFDFDFKDEVLEGDYILENKNKLQFNITSFKYRLIETGDDYGKAFLDSIPENPNFSAEIDSCNHKLKLVFKHNEIIPHKKHYNWVEFNRSGSFISYAEGVREELIIQENKDSVQVSYLSPRYQKPILLKVHDSKPDNEEIRVSFPNDPKKIYELSLSDNELYSMFTDDDNYIYERQVFFKLLNDSTDNPNDLSLRDREESYHYPENYSTKPDTTIRFVDGMKVKISSTTQQEFLKYYTKPAFESLSEQRCQKDKDPYLRPDTCLLEVEKVILKKSNGVSRIEDFLVFQIDNNYKHFLLNNITYGENTKEFYYKGELKSSISNIFIAHGQHYEWSDHYLIHQKSGEEIKVTGFPAISPHGKYIAVFDNLGIYTFAGVRMQIWEIKAYGFDLIWEFHTNYYPENFAWIDNQSFVFNIVSYQKEIESVGYGKLEIIN